jgi:hypothetical protein
MDDMVFAYSIALGMKNLLKPAILSSVIFGGKLTNGREKRKQTHINCIDSSAYRGRNCISNPR